MARSNLMQECPQLNSKSIEMVCADYLDGLKQARARCVCPLLPHDLNSSITTVLWQDMLAVGTPRGGGGGDAGVRGQGA